MGHIATLSKTEMTLLALLTFISLASSFLFPCFRQLLRISIPTVTALAGNSLLDGFTGKKQGTPNLVRVPWSGRYLSRGALWCRRHREFHLVSKRQVRSFPVRPRCHPNSLTLVSTQMKLIVAELSVFWVNESGFLGNPEGVILRAISEAVLTFAVDFW